MGLRHDSGLNIGPVRQLLLYIISMCAINHKHEHPFMFMIVDF